MTRARAAALAAATAYAVTLACAWLLLPSRVPVALQGTDVSLERWQYVVGAGLVGWALAVGSGGLGLGLDSLVRTLGRDAAEPGDLGTWLEAWVLGCATVVVWLQVVAGAGRPGWLEWSQAGVVLVGFAGAAVLLAGRALAVRRRR
jgi:hypothetical protein